MGELYPSVCERQIRCGGAHASFSTSRDRLRATTPSGRAGRGDLRRIPCVWDRRSVRVGTGAQDSMAVFRHLCALSPFLDEMSSVCRRSDIGRQQIWQSSMYSWRRMEGRRGCQAFPTVGHSTRLSVYERQVWSARAPCSSTVLALSALDFDTAIRDPHRVRRDALLSRWALDLAIGYAEAGTVPRASDDIAL